MLKQHNYIVTSPQELWSGTKLLNARKQQS